MTRGILYRPVHDSRVLGPGIRCCRSEAEDCGDNMGWGFLASMRIRAIAICCAARRCWLHAADGLEVFCHHRRAGSWFDSATGSSRRSIPKDPGFLTIPNGLVQRACFGKARYRRTRSNHRQHHAGTLDINIRRPTTSPDRLRHLVHQQGEAVLNIPE